MNWRENNRKYHRIQEIWIYIKIAGRQILHQVKCEGRIWSKFLIEEVKAEISSGGINEGLYTEEK